MPLLSQIGWDQQQAQQLWWEVDKDRSGALTKSEFLRFCQFQNVQPYIIQMEQNLLGGQQTTRTHTGLDQSASYAGQGTAYSGQDAYVGSDAGFANRNLNQGQQTMELAEEKLKIDKITQQAGQVDLNKHVETQQVHTSVPVVHEEIVIERHPVTDGRPGVIEPQAATISVPLMREEVNVEKHAAVVEEVSVGKRPVQEQQEVNVELARERLDINDQREQFRGQQTNLQQQPGLHAQAGGYTGPQGTQYTEQNLGTGIDQTAGYTGPQGTQNLGTGIREGGNTAASGPGIVG